MLTSLTLIAGCGRNPGDRLLAQAAERKGTAEAGLHLERQPDDCGRRVPHVRILPGIELQTIVDLYIVQLNTANTRIVDCYDFNETNRTELSGH